MVIGTDLMNEPWPGADWQTCAAPGCPDLERRALWLRSTGAPPAIRALGAEQLVFVEPFVLFNFGQAPTPSPAPTRATRCRSTRMPLDVAGERGVVRKAVAAAERDGAPLLVTEFGASSDASC